MQCLEGEVGERKWVTVKLEGGLGNRLFQLAAADWYAHTYGKTCVICLDFVEPNSHSQQNYVKIFFTGFPIIDHFPQSYVTIQEKSNDFGKFINYPNHPNDHVLLKGYFQSSEYILPHFHKYLCLQNDFDNEKDTDSAKVKSFLHVRRGDFLQFSLHNINLSCYFQYLLHKTHNVYVISDDIDWCRKQFIFGNCHFYECQNELETIKFMAQCNNVAICSNSTFAFWGSYFSTCKTIYLPKPWMNKPNLHIELDLKNKTQWVDAFIWPWTIYSVDIDPSFGILQTNQYKQIVTFRDGLKQLEEETNRFQKNQYALFITYTKQPINAQIFTKLQHAANEFMNFDMIVLRYKGRIQTEFIKSTLALKIKWIEEPTVFLFSSLAAKKWLENPNWNQFSRNFVLKV